MKSEMMAYCGTYCETCDWKEKMNCKGCKVHEGEVFWGTCAIAKCTIDKGLDHCGKCTDLPCEKLKGAYSDLEHGDNGERLINLKNWAQGKPSMLKVSNLKN